MAESLLETSDPTTIDEKLANLTVVDAFMALDTVCDGAASKDGLGFNKYDRERYSDLIVKVISGRPISRQEEDDAFRICKKYAKQLETLGIKYSYIGHIPRDKENDITANPSRSDLFSLTLPQLIETKTSCQKQIQQELAADKINWDLIESFKITIKHIDGLIEIKDPEIERKALEIMMHGDPVDYVIQVYNRLHVSDTNLGKIMLISIASQSALTTDGTQPKGTGPSGKGKTHAFSAMYHLIPNVGYKLDGSLSAKTLFYSPDLMPGTIIYTDDVRISDDLDDTLKRAMSNFQNETIHMTVINGRHYKLTIPPRTVFWMTKVDSDFSTELLNRLYDLNVDESTSTDAMVTDQRLERAATGEEALPVDEDVKICRAIIHMVRCKIFRVTIPYATYINWKGSGERRNLNRFLDLVQGFAVLRFMQRNGSSDGKIQTTLKDFEDAKALYDATSGTQITKLTDAERRLARWLAGKRKKTINEMVREFLKPDNSQFTYTAIYQWIKGNKGKGGLLDKVPGLMKSENNGEEAYELPKFDEGAVGSIVSLKAEAYEIFSKPI
jgi:hypothetical protein